MKQTIYYNVLRILLEIDARPVYVSDVKQHLVGSNRVQQADLPAPTIKCGGKASSSSAAAPNRRDR